MDNLYVLTDLEPDDFMALYMLIKHLIKNSINEVNLVITEGEPIKKIPILYYFINKLNLDKLKINIILGHSSNKDYPYLKYNTSQTCNNCEIISNNLLNYLNNITNEMKNFIIISPMNCLFNDDNKIDLSILGVYSILMMYGGYNIRQHKDYLNEIINFINNRKNPNILYIESFLNIIDEKNTILINNDNLFIEYIYGWNLLITEKSYNKLLNHNNGNKLLNDAELNRTIKILSNYVNDINIINNITLEDNLNKTNLTSSILLCDNLAMFILLSNEFETKEVNLSFDTKYGYAKETIEKSSNTIQIRMLLSKMDIIDIKDKLIKYLE